MRLNSPFRFTKSQQQGIFLLLLLIFIIQILYYCIDAPRIDYAIDQSTLDYYQDEMDSLRAEAMTNRKPKIYPFNPNFITDYKGYTLGMKNDEIDRLLTHRAKGKWINTASQFQKVTGVSDSLLDIISPYFKFPDWVTNPRPKHYSNYNIEKI